MISIIYDQYTRLWAVLLSAMLLILVSACAGIPLQEISDARQALSAAEEVKADEYAPIHYERAETLLGRAERAMAAGDYDKARGEATFAREEAFKARERSLEALQHGPK
ncbi:MAG: DUF4398 domain-containing protein [Gammaproteobacteria bacterium]